METTFQNFSHLQPNHPLDCGYLADGKPGMIIPAMIKVMKGISSIGKDQKNKDQGFNYRGIDDVYNHIQPLLAENGIICRFRLVMSDEMEGTTKSGSAKMRVLGLYMADFFAEDGSRFTVGPLMGEAADTGDKVYNKTASIADKYLLLTAFKIPTKDPEGDNKDPDSRVPEPHDGNYQRKPKATTQVSKPAPVTKPETTPPATITPPNASTEPMMTEEQRSTLLSYWKTGMMKKVYGDETGQKLEIIKAGLTAKEADAFIQSIREYGQ
jgi:hypothetical protein